MRNGSGMFGDALAALAATALAIVAVAATADSVNGDGEARPDIIINGLYDAGIGGAK